MKRLVAVALFVLLVPPGAWSDDISDGAACMRGEAPVAAHHYQSLDDPTTADPSNADRVAVCVHVQGTTVFYFGGEVIADEDPGFGGACGSVIVLGEGVDSGRGQDWNNAGPDGQKGTADDQHCD